MTLAATDHENNVVLGAGEVFIDILDDDDNLTGERYLGDAVSATINVTTERTTIQSGTGRVAKVLVDVPRSISRSVGFTVRDMSVENWSLFLIADEAEKSVATARVTGANAYKITKAKRGRWYQLGSGPDMPSGVGPVTDKTADTKTAGAHDAGNLAVIVTSAAAAPASGNEVARAANYEVDKQSGRIRILDEATDIDAGGSGTDIWVHYQPASEGDTALTAARKFKTAQTSRTPKAVVCALRYIEDPSSGDGRNVFVRKCSLVPGGEMALVSRDTEQQASFTGTEQDPPAGWHGITVDDLPLNAA